MPTGECPDRRWRELEEPAVGGATARAEVEVEGVYVEECKHDALPKMQGPFLSERPCALSPKLPGAVMRDPERSRR